MNLIVVERAYTVKRAILLLALAVFVLAMPGERSCLPGSIAHAQQNKSKPGETVKRRPNLLELLFGGGLRKQMLQRQTQPPQARRIIVARKKNAGGSVTSLAPAQRLVVVKSETASKILVIGDFIADGLNWGLQQVYASNPNAVLVNQSSGLSGMVRDDVVNWPVRIGELIDEIKPVAVVVQVGMNDRQQMRVASGKVAKLSEPWRTEYELRVDAAVKAVRSRNLPLIWLGLPPVRSGAMNPDYLVFNEIYRSKVEAAGGNYIDVWDGFTNAEGQFVNAGPDINGQIVRLRNADGINLTRAGMSKMAFYAEKELKKATGLGADALIAALSGPAKSDAVLEPAYDPIGTGRTIVVELDSPQADGGFVLEGAEGFLADKAAANSVSFVLVDQGSALQPQPGRIDAGWGSPATPVKKPASAVVQTPRPAVPAAGTGLNQ